MTNKIIEAAREAGWSEMQIKMAWPTDHERLTKFYALARAEALEDAAKVAFNADHMGSVNLKLMKNRIGNAIRALKEQQHG